MRGEGDDIFEDEGDVPFLRDGRAGLKDYERVDSVVMRDDNRTIDVPNRTAIEASVSKTTPL